MCALDWGVCTEIVMKRDEISSQALWVVVVVVSVSGWSVFTCWVGEQQVVNFVVEHVETPEVVLLVLVLLASVISHSTLKSLS